MARVITVKQSVVTFRQVGPKMRRALALEIKRQLEGLALYIQKTFFRWGARRSVRYVVNRSGNLMESVRPMPVKGGRSAQAPLEGIIRMGGRLTPYAVFVEEGTRPHVIRPKKAGGVLRFEKESGEVVFTRVVHHPGSRPRYPIAKGMARRQLSIIKAIERRFKTELVERIA